MKEDLLGRVLENIVVIDENGKERKVGKVEAKASHTGVFVYLFKEE